ncbi:MAG: class III poly(R)-hydroxyalkanoic acid synthase subunit PhaC [Cycloclasticus sp.]|nr:MAG: class III poly(R)-hydroxyalkanoic acid synthase subunit PhaC [Cycloclasticus sp.]
MPSNDLTMDDIWQNDFSLLMEQLGDGNNINSPEVGTTPKELIYTENKLKLYRYLPLGVKQKKTPLLITYALVNRPYIVDLEPDRSLVLRLLEHGHPIYLIDWGYPDSSDCFTNLNDYINGLMHRCVQHTKRNANTQKVNLLGICQGGVFSLCYAALKPKQIRQLITLVTPVDFHSESNLLSLWANGIQHTALTNNAGNIPSHLISQLFKTLKPFQLNREKYRQLSHVVSKKRHLDTFLRMEKWLSDGPDLAGAAASEFMESFYQNNGLLNNQLFIGKEKVLLEKINCPVLNLYATKDHIVPPTSAQALRKHIKPSLYTKHLLHGGHIGAFTSLKTQRDLINTLNTWLK